MNQKLWKERLESVFEGHGYVVFENENDRQRNVYVCKEGNSKRLISVWPNKELYNVVIQKEVQEDLGEKGFAFASNVKVEGNRFDYRQVTEGYVLRLCRAYVENN